MRPVRCALVAHITVHIQSDRKVIRNFGIYIRTETVTCEVQVVECSARCNNRLT